MTNTPARPAVPGTVRAAGALVSLEGLAGIAFAVVLLVAGSSGPGRNIYGEVGYFVVIFGAVLACGIGLLRGGRWARGPVTAVQILLLGVAWYAIGPSSQPLLGAPVAVLVVVVLVLLFRAPSRAWAEGHAPSQENAK
ncbi:membrane protein [Kibdelosporangium lantanae]